MKICCHCRVQKKITEFHQSSKVCKTCRQKMRNKPKHPCTYIGYRGSKTGQQCGRMCFRGLCSAHIKVLKRSQLSESKCALHKNPHIDITKY